MPRSCLQTAGLASSPCLGISRGWNGCISGGLVCLRCSPKGKGGQQPSQLVGLFRGRTRKASEPQVGDWGLHRLGGAPVRGGHGREGPRAWHMGPAGLGDGQEAAVGCWVLQSLHFHPIFLFSCLWLLSEARVATPSCHCHVPFCCPPSFLFARGIYGSGSKHQEERSSKVWRAAN